MALTPPAPSPSQTARGRADAGFAKISARVLVSAAALALATALGCGPAGGPGGERASVPPARDIPVVAATVAPHAWLVRQIAGDAFRVETVLPPDADPHSHTPTDAEVTRLARAHVLFRSGVPFENGTWIRALESRGVRLVDLRRHVDLLEDSHGHGTREARGQHETHEAHGTHEAEVDHSGEAGDPHTWTSPRRLVIQARSVADALKALRPALADEIEGRRQAVTARLQGLDADLATRLEPHAGRAFYVHHPSWSYFAADYGLEQVALESRGSEPSDAEITAWLRRALADGARAVFTQPQTADRAPRVVAEALGARLEILDPLAADVPTELARAAERLAASWTETESRP